MRDLRTRVAILAWLFALPPLMALMSPRGGSILDAALPVAATECVLLCGLVVAIRSRGSLLATRRFHVTGVTPIPAPHAWTVRLARKAPAGRA